MTPEKQESQPHDACQVTEVHQQRIDAVQKEQPEETVLLDLAELFKVLGDGTRVRILNALSISELCVCDLATLLSMSSSAISHQLRILRAAKVVKFRKDGKNAFYSLDDEHVRALLSLGLEHVTEK